MSWLVKRLAKAGRFAEQARFSCAQSNAQFFLVDNGRQIAAVTF
jgi:hypothetical protein